MDKGGKLVWVHNKAMRLPEIFDISGKSKVKSGKSKIFKGQKSSETKLLFFCFDLRKSPTKTTKTFSICRKFRYTFDIFDIRRYMSKIDNIVFDIFDICLSIKWPKFTKSVKKDSKNGQKIIPN